MPEPHAAAPAGGRSDHEPDGRSPTDRRERTTAATVRAQLLRAQADALIDRAEVHIAESEQRISRLDRATAHPDRRHDGG